MSTSSLQIQKVISNKNAILIPSNVKQFSSTSSVKQILNISKKRKHQSFISSHDNLQKSKNTIVITKKQLISQKSKIMVKPSRKTKLSLKLGCYCYENGNIQLQSNFLNMLDQAINCSNLKIYSLDLNINNSISHSDLDNVIIRFYKRLRRHTNQLQHLKLKLQSLNMQNRLFFDFMNQKINAIRFTFLKLTNLKVLSLNITLDYHSIISRNLNNLYQGITLYLKNLRSFKLVLNNNYIFPETLFRLTINWSLIKKLKNLVSFTLNLWGKFICSKSNIISLLTIVKHHPNLKKYSIYLGGETTINLTPFKNLEKYFGKLNILENLKIRIPYTEKNQDISDGLIKTLKKYKNLKVVDLICGKKPISYADNSTAFSDKVEEIFECLKNLIELQEFRLTYSFNSKSELVQLANALTQMQKLLKLKLYMKYLGIESDIFSDFMTSVQFSPNTLKDLDLTLETHQNSGISHKFWKSFAKLLPHNTLESLKLLIIVSKLYMNNHCMEIFVNNLAKNINLSSLILEFEAMNEYDGAGLIWIPKILKKFKFIKKIKLYFNNVEYLNMDFFHILQNSLKDKHLNELTISINYDICTCIFPSNALNSILRILNYNDRTLNEFFLTIPISGQTNIARNKILNLINIRQIPLAEIEIQEYENNKDITCCYIMHRLYSPPYRTKICYKFDREFFEIDSDDDDDDISDISDYNFTESLSIPSE